MQNTRRRPTEKDPRPITALMRSWQIGVAAFSPSSLHRKDQGLTIGDVMRLGAERMQQQIGQQLGQFIAANFVPDRQPSRGAHASTEHTLELVVIPKCHALRLASELDDIAASLPAERANHIRDVAERLTRDGTETPAKAKGDE